MVVLGKNMAIRMLLILCVLTQGVMLFPHHHHGQSDVPCLDFTHCIGAHDACNHSHDAESLADKHDCGGHRHDGATGTCALERDIVAELCSGRAQSGDTFSPEWLELAVFSAFASETAGIEQVESTLARLRDKERPFVERLYLTYLTRASLLRAPTGLA